MTHLDYIVDAGQLVVREGASQRIIRRQTFETPVERVFPLPAGDGCLVLLVYSGSKKFTFDNLFKVGADGSIVWTAELPESHDAFVHAAVHGERIEANSWSCWRVEIDPTNGRITTRAFTK